MGRYLAKMKFNININEENQSSQFDEQTRVIEAKSSEEAFIKARSLGRKEEEVFLNKENKSVRWKFIDVIDLFHLEQAKDGEQLYSLTHEKEDAKTFINYIRHKSMVVQSKSLTFV